MNLINSIPKEHLDAFREYANVCDGTAFNPNVSNEHIFRCWNENKQNLYEILGNNFIISKEVEYKRPQRVLESDIYDTLLNYPHPFIERVTALARNYDSLRWESEPGSEKRNYYARLSLLLYKLTYCDTLAINKLRGETVILSKEFTPTGKDIKIQVGMKAIRALETLAKAYDIYDKEEFEDFRLQHSRCLNDKLFKGNLCLSIHPLDYATMSDNTCGWSSCMSWIETGDYRQGTIEMMNSPYMVVAYLTSSKPYEMGGIGMEWNSKKWRKLYAVTPDLLMGVKAYPYPAEDLDRICLDWLRELASAVDGYGPYENEMCRAQNNGSYYDQERTTYLNMNHMYCDLSHNHLAYFKMDLKNAPEYCLSGESECLVCGRIGSDHIEPNAFDCHDCGDYCYCAGCGSTYRWNEEYWHRGPDGEWICDCCYHDDTMNCECCDELIQCNDTNYIRILVNGVYCISKDICSSCYDKYEEYLERDEYGILRNLEVTKLPPVSCSKA